MTHKLIIDLFAGGGGASMGIEMALGRSPDVAVNHDPVAIAMHTVNHPETLHLCNDVWQVDPNSVRPGEPVGLLWASPDCKHFSKAKGGKPKDRNIRDLAWVIVDWAEKRKPDVIIVENVEEFRTWGPLYDDGTPIPEFVGQIFDDWVKRLQRAGYKVDWRESRASAYGAPTIRKRLCIIASRIGKPRWPKPTHADPGSLDVAKGLALPWRTAAEHVIDWTLPCPSIFDDKATIKARYGLAAVRPLAHNTGARVARGIRRYVLETARPFIVGVGGRMGQSPERPADMPFQTITAKADSCVVVPNLLTLTHGGRELPAEEPLRTVTCANRGEMAVIAPSITRFNSGATGSAIDEPLPTVTANSFIQRPGGAAPLGVLAPVLTYAQQGGRNRPADAPLHTVTASAKDQNAVIAPHLMTMRNSGKPFQGADEPTHTVTAGGAGLTCIAASLVQTGYGEREGQQPRALDPEAPLGTVVAGGGKHAAVAAFLAQHNNDSRRDGGVNPGRDARAPVSTLTTSGSHQSVVAAHMLTLKGSDRRASDCEEPARAICAQGTHEAVVTGALVKYYGTGDGQEIEDPLHTVTVKDRFGFVEAMLAAPPFGPEHEARAREVAEFLRFHGAWHGGEFVTLEVEGITFIIADIGMRMLTPRELFNAQGFPRDYRIDRDADGNVFSKSDQIGRAGNSVSPPWAAAHVAANCRHLMAEPEHMEAAE